MLKKNNLNKPELLAPCKDLETGITAIQCGADAVYIGTNKFGARSNAGNNIEDIEKLIRFAHKYRARVYITLNTLLTDSEIPEAYKLIKSIYDIGADAVIIQDMGILELDLPPIPIFASTQCHNITWQKVDFFEKIGIQRVILPRELSLKQIKEIKSKTNIDLECFIHGALCVCYSGQCYMSYVNGGRSGNRGECAQPCRKKYTLKDTKGNIICKDKYLLSLKDLNLSAHLDELIEAGIGSFKIEGRLKDINYIKNIVSYYRHKIDKTMPNFAFNPDKTFNRGYTTYFLTGRQKAITSFDSPKHIGEPMGLIETTKLNNGDGITYFDKNRELHGTNEPKSLKKGTFIYRNYDHEYIKGLKALKAERKINININIDFNCQSLTITDEIGCKANLIISDKFESAKNKEEAVNNIKKQFSKLGDTIFYLKKIHIQGDNIPFIPVSILNEKRREAIKKLEENRSEKYPAKLFKINANNYPYPDKILDYRANILNAYAESFYKWHGVTEIAETAPESDINMKNKKIMTTKHCLKYSFNLCKKSNEPNEPNEPLYLTDEKNSYKLEFDCDKCEMYII